MAKAGLGTWIIQLIGRWGSQAVYMYVRDAPLTTSHRWASQVARGLLVEEGAAMSIKSSGSTTNSDGKKAGREIRHIVTTLASQTASELGTNAEEHPLKSKLGYVRNLESHVTHQVLIGGLGSSPMLWQTCCGWRFAKSLHAERCEDLPAAHKMLCERCFPEERARAKAKSVEIAGSQVEMALPGELGSSK